MKKFFWMDRVWRGLNESLTYLERCAAHWEGLGHPDQAARVRAYAIRIKKEHSQ
jgi:hypothetical protein